MTSISQHLAQERGDMDYEPLTSVECRDGFLMSVQASRFHYCSPRTSTGPWSDVEIGYPSEPEPALLRWAEEPSDPTGTVYAHVPIALVQVVKDTHDAIGALRDGDELACVMSDALRDAGRLRSGGDPSGWTTRERMTFGKCVATMRMFEACQNGATHMPNVD